MKIVTKVSFLIVILLLCSITIFLLLSLSKQAKRKSQLSGKLYYAVSNNIMEFDFETKKRNKLFEAPFYTLFNYASKFSNEKIIYQVLSSDEGSPIQSFNLTDKRFESIAEGTYPTYIKSANTLFYYKYKNKKDTVSLYMKYLSGNSDEIVITESTKRQSLEHGKPSHVNIVNPVVPISNNEVIFINIDRKLEIYNYQKRMLRKTNINNLIPCVWRSKTNSLICRHIGKLDYFEVNINNSSVKNIHNLNSVTGNILYISDYDCLIYSKYRNYSKRSDVYVFWLSDNNKEDKLWSNDHIASSVWFKNGHEKKGSHLDQ